MCTFSLTYAKHLIYNAHIQSLRKIHHAKEILIDVECICICHYLCTFLCMSIPAIICVHSFACLYLSLLVYLSLHVCTCISFVYLSLHVYTCHYLCTFLCMSEPAIICVPSSACLYLPLSVYLPLHVYTCHYLCTFLCMSVPAIICVPSSACLYLPLFSVLFSNCKHAYWLQVHGEIHNLLIGHGRKPLLR